MKRILALCLAFVMVIGLFGVSVPVVASETPNATVSAVLDKQLTDKHLRVSVTTNDAFAEGTNVTGNIYVGGNINSNLSLYKYGPSHYVVFMDSVEVTQGTTLKLGGVYTASNGSQVNFAEQNFVYNGSYWEMTVPTANATVSKVLDTSITSDKHLRMAVTTDDTFAEGTKVTGDIHVNNTLNNNLYLYKYGPSHYVVFMDGVEVIQGTKLKLGGVYQTADGRKVQFAETTFVHNGNYWEIVIPTANATVSKVVDTSITADKHLRMAVTTDDTFADGTKVTGDIYLGDNLDTSLYLYKYTPSNYVVFTDSSKVENGTTLKLGGVYQTSDGRKIEFAETTFGYNGSYWEIVLPTANATVSKVVDTSITADKHLRMAVTTDDTFATGTKITGDIYVGDNINSSLYLYKYTSSNYVVFMDGVDVTEGTKLKIGGVYKTSGGSEVYFAEIAFVYNGTHWEVDLPTAHASVSTVVDKTVTTDKHLRMSVATDDTFSDGTKVTGDIYVGDNINSSLYLYKYTSSNYVVFMDGIEVTKGTTLKLGGVYKTADGRKVEFAESTFVYTGEFWDFAFTGEAAEGTVTQIVDHFQTDAHIRFTVESEDTIGINAPITGKIYVDGKLSSDATIRKYANGFYVIYMKEAKVGTVVTIGGLYHSTSVDGVKFSELSFKYDGENWDFVFAGKAASGEITQIVDHKLTDPHIRFKVESEDTIAINMPISGDIYVDGKLNSDATIRKYGDGLYVIYMEEAKAGTTVTIGGLYYSTAFDGVEFSEVGFRYDGDNWDFVFAGEAASGQITQIVDDKLTDPHIRFTVDSKDTIKVNMPISGNIYVDGKLSTEASIRKYGDGFYVIYMEEAKSGTIVTIGGLYYSTSVDGIKFSEVSFKYDGDNWHFVFAGKATSGQVTKIVDSKLTDPHIRFFVESEDTIEVNMPISGNIYVNGKLSSEASIRKYGDGFWVIYMEEAKAGTTVKIEGIYHSTPTDGIEFPTVTFVYDGNDWRFKFTGKAIKTRATVIMDHNYTDPHIRFRVSQDDTIGVNQAITGDIYVNGKLSSDVSIMKFQSGSYALFLEEATAGMTVKLDGIYYSTPVDGIEFTPVTFVYDGVNWGMEETKAQAIDIDYSEDIEVYEEDIKEDAKGDIEEEINVSKLILPAIITSAVGVIVIAGIVVYNRKKKAIK